MQLLTWELHTASGLKSAERATQISFGTSELRSIPAEEILGAFSKTQKYTLPSSEVGSANLLSLAVASGLVGSKCKSPLLCLPKYSITNKALQISQPKLAN